jgi:Na+/H+-translocating membrane pyrophosphatase
LKKILELVFGVTPAVALGFANQWLDLFRNTIVLRGDMPAVLVNTALALSVFLSIFFVLIGDSIRPEGKLGASKCLLTCFIVLIIVCLGIRLFLNWPRSRDSQAVMTTMWDLCGWVGIVAAILAITFASMYGLLRKSP